MINLDEFEKKYYHFDRSTILAKKEAEHPSI
jgi:hypothetical protein